MKIFLILHHSCTTEFPPVSHVEDREKAFLASCWGSGHVNHLSNVSIFYRQPNRSQTSTHWIGLRERRRKRGRDRKRERGRKTETKREREIKRRRKKERRGERERGIEK